MQIEKQSAPIPAAFARAKAEGRTAIIPYVMAGYPDLESSEAIAVALGEAGADLLELGIPFSDPLADGTTIQAASQAALDAGMTPVAVLELAGRITARTSTPLMVMTYYNPIFSYGLAHFCEAAADAGVAGLIVPDLPPEEAEVLGTAAEPHGLALVYLVAPTSTDERIERIARAAEANGRGFLYCVSLSGVTGARDRLPEHLAEFLARVRARSRLPLAVGFGVSRPEHVAEIGRYADGAVVASALLNVVDAAPPEACVQAAVEFLRKLRLGSLPASAR
jgi:tryptophan synthase alpha chain